MADDPQGCPCDLQATEFEPVIPAAQDVLARQTRTFAGVRNSLLAAVSAPARDALRGWQARGERDLGLMWLEMWAYVADVLNFYDERIANESYLRTAQRRVSLRRLIELLGYIQAPGVAGSVALGAIASGDAPTELPAGTAFRSDAFGNEPPQVFELESATVIDPLKNEWKVGPLKKGGIELGGPSQPPGQSKVSFLAFETSDLGLAPERLLALSFRGSEQSLPLGDRVDSVRPFTGVDGRNYAEVELANGLTLAANTAPERVLVRTPTSTAGVRSVSEFGSPRQADLTLDAVYQNMKVGTYVLVTRTDTRTYVAVRRIDAITTVTVGLGTDPDVKVPVTKIRLNRTVSGAATHLVVNFDLVQAGRVTTLAVPEITGADLVGTNRVPLDGRVQAPRDATSQGSARRLSQEFLLQGKSDQGAHAVGNLEVGRGGRARFGVTQTLAGSLGSFDAPLSVFGNVLWATRGESVADEVLGDGNPRETNQQFRLKKGPLTYLQAPELPRGIRSTLEVRVDGVVWTEVRTFLGCGPEDQVYIVRHDDEQATLVTFGDGRRGARLSSGVQNVRASYRFGSGAAVPPAGAITQLARTLPGIRSVRSPVAARPGRDPDGPETLRTRAPQSLLLLGRAVSVADFEALAAQVIGVVRAVAEYVWLPNEQSAGVRVSYIGEVTESELLRRLRSQADPTLHIEVTRATRLARSLSLSVAVRTGYDQQATARAVQVALTRPGAVLSIEAAQIGGQLWSSHVYEAALSVPGVVAVTNATLYGGAAPQALAVRDVVCVPRSSYFAFGNVQGGAEQGVSVVPVDAGSAVPKGAGRKGF